MTLERRAQVLNEVDENLSWEKKVEEKLFLENKILEMIFLEGKALGKKIEEVAWIRFWKERDRDS